MNKVLCTYSIIQYIPFRETEEFANIGIVLLDAEKSKIYYKLMNFNQGARVKQFFHDAGEHLFKMVLKNSELELADIAENINKYRGSIGGMLGYFDGITSVKESVVAYGDRRTLLTDNPEAELDRLFNYYIARNFVTKHYKNDMTTKVRNILNRRLLGLADQFKRANIGDEHYTVKFDFVREFEGIEKRIIQPIKLFQDRATEVVNAGNTWINKISELKERDHFSGELLFVVNTPKEKLDTFSPANDEYFRMLQKMRDFGLKVSAIDDSEDIAKFAVKGVAMDSPSLTLN